MYEDHLYFLYCYNLFVKLIIGENSRTEYAAEVFQKNERKRILTDLKSSLRNAILFNKSAYDIHAFHLASLEGLGMRSSAFEHILNLLKEQKRKHRKKSNSSNFSFLRSTCNLERKGFQHLFMTYFSRFRSKTQKVRILTAALNWVREGPIEKSTLEIGEIHTIINFFIW